MDLATIIKKLDEKGVAHLLGCGQRGIEKEGLRYDSKHQLSENNHPKSLGSALTHPEITTDYAESLLEIVTPAFRNSRDTLNHLAYLHRVITLYTNEYMLNASMPAHIKNIDQVKIGYYGKSNAGMMRSLYRKGLALRYGKPMQLISGIHFNYSICNDLFRHYAAILDQEFNQNFINDCYMNMIRNIRIYGWIIPYLFGHSPALDSSFFANRKNKLDKLCDDTLYLPHATSLRMSDIGYKNKNKQLVSANTLAKYISDLKREVQAPSIDYQKIGLKDSSGNYQQINTNVLQIENEYYTSARPKQITASGETQLNALHSRGISYVELRLLDINCLAPYGINEDQLDFLEMYMLFCLFKSAPKLSYDDEQIVEENITQTSSNGRSPKFYLNHFGKSRSVSDWGEEIIREMQIIAEAMDFEKHRPHYASNLEFFSELFSDPNKTPSAKLIQTIKDRKTSYHQLITDLSYQQALKIKSQGLTQAEKNKIIMDSRYSFLAEERLYKESQNICFDDYLNKYFKQLNKLP